MPSPDPDSGFNNSGSYRCARRVLGPTKTMAAVLEWGGAKREWAAVLGEAAKWGAAME